MPLLWLTVVACAAPNMWLCRSVAQSDDAVATLHRRSIKTKPDQTSVQEIDLGPLGEPPPQLAELIEIGNVRLVTGGAPVSDPDTLPVTGRLAGETRFTFRYHYDSRARWQITESRAGDPANEPIVQLRVRFRTIELITTHDVWLRQPPGADEFWSNQVVRHEFDHVRVSSDPRIEKMFLAAAKKLESLRVPLSEVRNDRDQIDNKKVQSLIEKKMKQTLEDTTEYVRIRYRELDRLTDHGLKPIPEGARIIPPRSP
jgi:hypothetical protein